MKTQKLTVEDIADFTWSFHHTFFLETDKGNDVWSDPDYEGVESIIRPFKGDLQDWYKSEGIPFGRSKGRHTIGGYCGYNVRILDP